MRARRGTLLVVAAVVISTATMIGAGTASAKAAKIKPNLTCNLTGVATVTPGLSSTAAIQTLAVTTALSGCTSTNTSGAGITGSSSATTSSTGKKAANCTSAATKPTVSKVASATINWNNATSSIWKYKTTLRLGEPATLKGKILSGTFAKGKVTATLTYVYGAGQNCFTTPVTSAVISGTLNIT